MPWHPPRPCRRSYAPLVDSFKERARKAALPEKDAQDIAYALVALIDEVALPCAGAAAWLLDEPAAATPLLWRESGGRGLLCSTR